MTSDQTSQPVDPALRDNIASHAAKQFQGAVETFVADLRKIADDVERLGHNTGQPRNFDAYDAKNVYTDTVTNMIHTLNWGNANAQLDQVLRYAIDADLALRMAVTDSTDDTSKEA